ncbi:Peroxidase 41 [Sarracenia purpurea var. burkii]
MAFPLLLFLALSSLSTITHSKQINNNAGPKLTFDFYAKTCPNFEKIMEQTVTDKQINNPTTAAATLRVFFHDCMVDGCDGSVLMSSTPSNQAERDFDINQSLAGDAFDLVTRAKNALELSCPGVVSCADILVIATRNLVKIVSGPLLKIPLGRRDGLISMASHVEGNLARVSNSTNQSIKLFRKKGFTVAEMVALIGGGHTIGFSHCKEFSNRLFNFSKTSDIDPSLNPKFADRLRNLCANYKTNPSMAAFNDPITPGVFDNAYFKNLQNGLGLLSSDQALIVDSRTKPFVELFATNQTAFFEVFARAMEKTSLLDVITGQQGEVRVRCDRVNSS